uniref:Keratin 97 n=1 Tax=Cyprinodon variegatus TaxID=28743 RepID=A0A3Q2DWA6_CYPVA
MFSCLQEIAALRSHVSTSSVNVEVDAKRGEDLSVVLEEMRSEYEGIVEKNRREMEASIFTLCSFLKKGFEELNKTMASSTETLQTSKSEINELKRKLQSLQIELQSEYSLKAALEGQLYETESRFSQQLSDHQRIVNSLEEELSRMRTDIERQSSEYQILLDIKTRLELEIAEYRRLLDGEDRDFLKFEYFPTDKPVITKRTKIVVEELVDGKVVSRTEDVDLAVVSE